MEIPRKHFNVVSTLFLGWYDVAVSDNFKSTLKQRCVCQLWINVVYFNVDMNNVRQRRKNVVIFNVEFHNVDQHRNNVMKMTIFKKVKKSKKILLSFKKKMTYLINNTCFRWWSIKIKREIWNVQCKNKRWKV